MSAWKFALPLLVFFALLAGCGGNDDPQAALEAAVQQLQDNLEAKKTSAVLEQLHPEFSAQQQFDRDWAKRTMTLLFLRHKNVKVIALSKTSQIDSTYSEKGHTDAQVAMTGAEGLIPDSARHYGVKLEWWLEDGEWKLARLGWE
ncbi:outer membrane protein assembly factor BamD [Pseudomonas borbori]